jgi:fluoride exporter
MARGSERDTECEKIGASGYKNMNTLLIIGIGGAIGSIARYSSQVYIYKLYPFAFPMGTFLVNITGCLLIGIFYGLSERGNVLTPEWRLFLMTGFCGGFTTFSSFAFENMNLLRNADFLYFGLYTLGSVVLGIAGVYLGVFLIKLF